MFFFFLCRHLTSVYCDSFTNSQNGMKKMLIVIVLLQCLQLFCKGNLDETLSHCLSTIILVTKSFLISV